MGSVIIRLEIWTAPCKNQVSKDVVTLPDTCSAAVTASARLCHALFCSRQLWMYGVHLASCFHTMYVLGLASERMLGRPRLIQIEPILVSHTIKEDQVFCCPHPEMRARGLSRPVMVWSGMNKLLMTAWQRVWLVIPQEWLVRPCHRLRSEQSHVRCATSHLL